MHGPISEGMAKSVTGQVSKATTASAVTTETIKERMALMWTKRFSTSLYSKLAILVIIEYLPGSHS